MARWVARCVARCVARVGDAVQKSSGWELELYFRRAILGRAGGGGVAHGRHFFREVCDLALGGDLWDRAKAYEATMESACWWWPHRDFVIVSERPTAIHRELVDPEKARGFGRIVSIRNLDPQ